MSSFRYAKLHGALSEAEPPLVFGVLLSGVATVLLGPLIPLMLPTWGVSTGEAASLFLFQFVTSSAGALIAGLHLRRSLVCGFGAVGGGLALLSSGHWSLAPPGMVLVGLGLGLAIPASNLIFALRNPSRRGAALNTMNLVWGLGAVGGPLLFIGAGLGLTPERVLALLAVASAAIGLSLFGRLRDVDGSGKAAASTSTVGTLHLLPIALMLFLYVGVETSIGGWLVTVAEREELSSGIIALVIGSGFWAALLIGRGTAPVLLRHLSESRLLGASLLVAATGAGCLLFSPHRWQIAVSAVVTGLGLAAVFPLIVSRLAAATRACGVRAAGWVFALGGIGGAALPWLSAQLPPGVGVGANPRFLVPALALALLLGLQLLYRRLRTAGAPRPLTLGVLAVLIGSLPTLEVMAQQEDGLLTPVRRAVADAEEGLRLEETQLAESRYRDALLEGWLLLGSLAMAEEDLPAASEAFEAAGRVAVATRRARTSLALVHLRRGEPEEALRLLRAILARNPDDVPSRRLLAQALAAAGEPEQALQELREALAAAPEDLETAYALAMAHLRAGKIEDAEELFARIIRERPLPRTHVLIGRTYRDLGHPDRAREELERALAMDPRARRAHFYLGTIELLTRQRAGIERAVGEFRRELELDPDDPITNLYLGMALVEDRRPEAAVAPLETAASSPATRGTALRYLGQAMLELDRIERAVTAFREALEALESSGADDRARASVHYQLGVALRGTGDPEAAAAQFETAERLNERLTEASREEMRGYLDATAPVQLRTDVFLPPGIAALAALPTAERQALRTRASTEMARAYFNLGILAARAQRHAAAARLLEQAADLEPDFEGLRYALGVAHFNAGQYARATGPLQAAFDADPGNDNLRRMTALAWLEEEAYERTVELLARDPQRHEIPSLQYAYGVALVRSGRARQAGPVFESLLARDADWPELHVMLGQAAAQLGDYPAAIASLDRALELDERIPEARSALAYIHLTRGQLDEAESLLSRELEIRPDDLRARYLLATVLDLQNRPGEAADHLRTLLAREPRFADARYLLGKLLVAEGSPEQAVEHLEAAVGLAPEDANIHYQLGLAYQRLGQPDRAEAAFARFRELKNETREPERR